MPRNASGAYSLPAGNPVVTQTVIASSWANTTLDDLRVEMTDSLSRSAKGGMLSPLGLTDGTAALPGLSFNTELSTGVYRPSANTLGLSVAGAQQLRLATVGPSFLATSPLAAGNTGTDFAFNTTSARTAGNLFDVQSGGASIFRIAFAGQALFSGSVPAVIASSTNTSLQLYGNRNAADAGTDVVLNSAATRTAGNLLAVQNNGTNYLRLQADGVLVWDATNAELRANVADGLIMLRSNRGAASAGTDILLLSQQTRTAGLLLDVQNNGASEMSLGFSGVLRLVSGAGGSLHTVDVSASDASNGALTLHGNKNAADAGADLVLTSLATRTAGNLLDTQNNGTSKFQVDFGGEIGMQGGLACGQVFKTDADQSSTSTTMANVTSLAFPVVANGIYVWEVLFETTTNINASFIVTFTGPAAPTVVAFGKFFDVAAYAAGFGSTCPIIPTQAGTVSMHAQVMGRLINGANAGTVQMQFATGSAGNQVTFRKGALLRWRRIG